MVMAFSWYIFVSGSGAFVDFLKFGNNLYSNFASDFFNIGSRGSTVLSGVGLEAAESALHQVGRYVFFLTEGLIIVGFLKLIAQRKITSYEREFMVMIVFNVVLLASTIIVPRLATSFRMERFYIIAVLFLSPLAISGIETFSKFGQTMWKRSSFLGFALVVLVIFFAFQSEFVYAITGDVTWTVEMSMYNPVRLRLSDQFVWEPEVIGGRWIDQYAMTREKLMVYSDIFSQRNVLTALGPLDREKVEALLSPVHNMQHDSLVYLRWINLDPGVMSGISRWKTADNAVFNSTTKIYSSGYCETYKIP
jgi:uncharacterized membrane protein